MVLVFCLTMDAHLVSITVDSLTSCSLSLVIIVALVGDVYNILRLISFYYMFMIFDLKELANFIIVI